MFLSRMKWVYFNFIILLLLYLHIWGSNAYSYDHYYFLLLLKLSVMIKATECVGFTKYIWVSSVVLVKMFSYLLRIKMVGEKLEEYKCFFFFFIKKTISVIAGIIMPEDQKWCYCLLCLKILVNGRKPVWRERERQVYKPGYNQ